MADPVDFSHSCSGSETRSTSRKGRCATRMKQLTANRVANQKITIELDNNLNPIGPNSEEFISYVGTVARTKTSILIASWKDVPAGVKDHIWETILLTFDVPDIPELKKRTIKHAGERWRAFKVSLGRKFIFNSSEKNVLDVYPFLDQETWDLFVQSRLEPGFQVKRKKGRENQSKNVYPHVLSRGGYKKLDQKMMQESTDSSEVIDYTPPPRHIRWKKARQRSTGLYTSEETRQVAEKIDALELQATQGTFVPTGREDILVAAIGKEDYPGCVRAVGWGVGLRQFFGSSSHHRRHVDDAERERLKQEIAAERREMEERILTELREMQERISAERMAMQEQMREQISEQMALFVASMSHQMPSAQPSIHVSTGGSCQPSPQPSHDHTDERIGEDDPDGVFKKLALLVVSMSNDAAFISLEHDGTALDHVYIPKKELLEMMIPKEMASACHISLWCTYLHCITVAQETQSFYGFIDPMLFRGEIILGSAGDEVAKIREILARDDHQFYLSPYLYRTHWQLLVLCPRLNLVVFLCPTKNKPSSQLKQFVDTCITANRMVHGQRLRKCASRWIYPDSHKQPGSWQCGYYVMKWMADIISTRITEKWEEIFNDPTQLSDAELRNIRERWIKFFLEMYQ